MITTDNIIKPNGVIAPSIYSYLNCTCNRIESLFFILFLLHHNSYLSFITNYATDRSSTFPLTINPKPIDYVNDSFSWSEVPQKHDFWESLDSIWRHFIRHWNYSHIQNAPNKFKLYKCILNL